MPALYTFLRIDVVEHSRMLARARTIDAWNLLDAFLDFVKEKLGKKGQLWGWQGDGGLCAFPAGPAHRYVSDAVESALEIVRGVSPFWLRPEPFEGAKTELRIRVAGHCGLAHKRKDLGRVHSEDINLACHLERQATPNSVVITDVAYRQCTPEIKRVFRPSSPEIVEGHKIWICDLYGALRTRNWEQVLCGIATLARKLDTRKYRPDLVVAGGRTAGIIGGMLAGNLGQPNFTVLSRSSFACDTVQFDGLNNLPHRMKRSRRRAKVLLCFYQVESGRTAMAFANCLKKVGIEDPLVATLYSKNGGRSFLNRAGINCVYAYEGPGPWEDAPWRLSEHWKWVRSPRGRRAGRSI